MMTAQQEEQHTSQFGAVSTLLIFYRGEKLETPLVPGTTVGKVKRTILTSSTSTSIDANGDAGDGVSKEEGVLLQPCDLKLMLKGKLLKEDDEDLYQTLVLNNINNKASKLQKVYRIMATGVSQTESARLEIDQANAPRIRDDLTQAGKREIARRQRLGRQVLLKQSAAAAAAARNNSSSTSNNVYGFDKIQTLPHLPNEAHARQILTNLANDPGILACMTKHLWKVGSLSELYPDGKVGQSAICVMGLNRNAGQEILLRLRTDDLQGFRKINSIRQVLYHELAHNVHSEHNAEFFQLMRTIERECQELDWTHGAELTAATTQYDDDNHHLSSEPTFHGGSYRLGGGVEEGLGGSIQQQQQSVLNKRELAARAALSRMTAQEEKEIENGCGCGQERGDLFLPKQMK